MGFHTKCGVVIASWVNRFGKKPMVYINIYKKNSTECSNPPKTTQISRDTGKDKRRDVSSTKYILSTK